MTSEQLLQTQPLPLILVGNAVPQSPLGPIIDQYRTVIRFNNYPLALSHPDLLPFLGTRTDLHCSNYMSEILSHPHPCHFAPHTPRPITHPPNPTWASASHVPSTFSHSPSTGLRLACLLSYYLIPFTIVHFDSFATGHAWNPSHSHSPSHSPSELSFILSLDSVTHLS